MGRVADWREGWREGWRETTRVALSSRGDPGDEADEFNAEAGDEPVERTTPILLPELEASSAGC